MSHVCSDARRPLTRRDESVSVYSMCGNYKVSEQGVYQCLFWWYSISQKDISDYVGVGTIVPTVTGLTDCCWFSVGAFALTSVPPTNCDSNSTDCPQLLSIFWNQLDCCWRRMGGNSTALYTILFSTGVGTFLKRKYTKICHLFICLKMCLKVMLTCFSFLIWIRFLCQQYNFKEDVTDTIRLKRIPQLVAHLSVVWKTGADLEQRL